MVWKTKILTKGKKTKHLVPLLLELLIIFETLALEACLYPILATEISSPLSQTTVWKKQNESTSQLKFYNVCIYIYVAHLVEKQQFSILV